MPRKPVTAKNVKYPASASRPKKKVTAKNRAHGKVKPSIKAMKKGKVPSLPLPGTKSRFTWYGDAPGADKVKKAGDRKVAQTRLANSPVVKKLKALKMTQEGYNKKKPSKSRTTANKGATSRRSSYTYIPKAKPKR